MQEENLRKQVLTGHTAPESGVERGLGGPQRKGSSTTAIYTLPAFPKKRCKNFRDSF